MRNSGPILLAIPIDAGRPMGSAASVDRHPRAGACRPRFFPERGTRAMLSTEDRPATLQNVNLRVERHGDERHTAADLKIGFQLPSSELDAIEKGLTEMLYRKPTAEGDQLQIDPNAANAFTVLKHPGLEPIRLKGKFPGYEISIADPNGRQIEDPENPAGPMIYPDALFLVDVELKKITVEAHDGGTASVTITASVPVDRDELADARDLLEAGDVLMTLTPPKMQAEFSVASNQVESVEYDKPLKVTH
jgi:hypothetical protein